MQTALHRQSALPPGAGDLEARCRAAFAADPALRAEFRTVDRLLAFERSLVNSPTRAVPPVLDSSSLEAEARAEFAADPALQAEFGDIAIYTAWRKAAAGGQARIYNPNRSAA